MIFSHSAGIASPGILCQILGALCQGICGESSRFFSLRVQLSFKKKVLWENRGCLT